MFKLFFVWDRHGQFVDTVEYNGSAADVLSFTQKLRGRGYWVQSVDDFNYQRGLDFHKNFPRVVVEVRSQRLTYHAQ